VYVPGDIPAMTKDPEPSVLEDLTSPVLSF